MTEEPLYAMIAELHRQLKRIDTALERLECCKRQESFVKSARGFLFLRQQFNNLRAVSVQPFRRDR